MLALPQSRRANPGASLVLVHTHMAMVRRIAWHVHGRISSGIDIEDLVQTGMVALIEASRDYEERGHAFATYASIRVRGAMIDALRKIAGQARRAMANRRAIVAASDRFTMLNGRVPSQIELARALSVGPLELRAMMVAAEGVRHQSLDALYSDHSMWFADLRDGADTIAERRAMAERVAAALAELPGREAMVLQLYFTEEMNLAEIGEALGLSAARVCQIKREALDKLRMMVRGLAG